jgi:enamine deaminase RidA (YjgF/YER057c/UK114 family)
VGLNILAILKQELGNLDRVKRIVKLLGMVNAAPDFREHSLVINGCSDLFVQIFGVRHARSAIGVGSLPFGITVEIEAVVEVEAS